MHGVGWHNLLAFADSACRARFGGAWLVHTDNTMNRVVEIFWNEVATGWGRHSVYSCTTSTCDSDWLHVQRLRPPSLPTSPRGRRRSATPGPSSPSVTPTCGFTGTADGRGYLAGRCSISSHISGSNCHDTVLVTHEMGHDLGGEHPGAGYWTATEHRTVSYCAWSFLGTCHNWGARAEAYTQHHCTLMHASGKHNPTPSTGDGHYWHGCTSCNEWSPGSIANTGRGAR